MDNNPQNTNPNPIIPPIPDESSSFTPSAGVPSAPTTSGDNTAKRSGNRGKVIATIFGLLLVVGGVVAGTVLVRNQQLVNQKAAGTECTAPTQSNPYNGSVRCGSPYCSTSTKGQLCNADGTWSTNCVDAHACGYTAGDYCQGEGQTRSCQNLGYSSDYTCGADGNCYCTGGNCGTRRDKRFIGCSSTDPCMNCYAEAGGSNVTCYRENSSCGLKAECMGTGGGGGGACEGTCFGSTWTDSNGVVHDVTNCGSVGYQGANGSCPSGQICCKPISGPPTPTPTPKPVCGQACSQTSDCQSAGNGGTVTCVNGTCQNAACIGKTVYGRNCDCSALNACGQPCSASLGLCQDSICTFVPTDGGQNIAGRCTSNTPAYCVDVATYNNPSLAPACNATVNANHWTALTVDQIREKCNPPISATCSSVKAYDTNWNLLTSSQLSSLSAGSIIRFSVMGTTSGSSFDKARFTVNGTQGPEVTTQKPNSPGEFYYEYTIPSGVTSFTVTAQIHLQSNDTWY